MFKLGEKTWIAQLLSSHIEGITVFVGSCYGKNSQWNSFFLHYSKPQWVICLLLSSPPFPKNRKKEKAFISVPWQCHSAVRKAVAQNAPGPSVWSIVRGMCDVFNLLLWGADKLSHNDGNNADKMEYRVSHVHRAGWYQGDSVWKLSVVLAQCLLCLTAKGIPIPSVVFVLFCWLSASLLLSLALEGWEECQDRGFGSGGKGVGAAGATCAPALGDLAPLQNRAGRWRGLSDKSVHYYRCTKCCSNGLQQCRGI